jgi:hypothetical protein
MVLVSMVRLEHIGGVYLDKLKSAIDQFKVTLNKHLREFIMFIKDDVLFVTYQPGEIDDLIAFLVDQEYTLGDDIWNDTDDYDHILIDFQIKKATLIKDNWLKVVKELEYPIYNVETFKELLPFYTK